MKKLQLKKEVVESLSEDNSAKMRGGFDVSTYTEPPRCNPDETLTSCFCEQPINTLKGCVYTYGCKTLPDYCM